MDNIVRAIKEVMMCVLWALVFGSTFLIFTQILMVVSY